jgi:hypothetical protein
MSNFTFVGGLYPNSRSMHEAIAESYLSADGNNGREDMLRFLAEQTDEEMAQEVKEQWFSGELDDEDGNEDRSGNDDFDPDDMAKAFATIRREFNVRWPADKYE